MEAWELNNALQDAIDSVKSAIEELAGIEDFSDFAADLKDTLASMRRAARDTRRRAIEEDEANRRQLEAEYKGGLL